jgi:hypothetical protein
MSKISTYEVAPVPKLADKLIGTSVGGEIEDVTYNFTLQELLDVFLPVIPANNLQGILDYGNTATQDINLFGTITTTNLDVTDTANLFITYLNEETHIVGGLFDSEDSIGLAGQVLTSTGEFVEWVTLPPIFTPNLQQVLDIGNTSDTGIILDAGLEALDVDTDTATINTNITIDGTITDEDASVGAAGTVLSSTVTGVKWVALPVYSATSPLLFNSATGVFSIQQATNSQSGYLSSSDWITFDGKQNAGNYITALTGEATASGPGSASVTLGNAAVIGKVLTGFNPTAGTINASDSILTAFGKTQSQINALVGGVLYKGTWNASANLPVLTSSVGVQGNYYVVNVAGNTNLNGITDWKVGDWAIFSESVWQKVDNTESVSSVNGFTGAVELTTDNIPEGTTNLYFLNSRARLALSFLPGSGAYDNTSGAITIPTDNNQILNGAGYITLSSLSATAPLTYNNLTGAFGIPKATTLVDGYLSATDWTTFNGKQNYLGGTGLVKSTAGTISYITDNSTNWNTAYDRSIVSAAVTGTTTKTLTLNEQDGGTITASWTDLDTGLTSVGVSMPSAFSVANSPLTANGTIAVTGAGTSLQYIDGTGALQTFPGLTGFVPYTGATANVDLGTFGLISDYLRLNITPSSIPTTVGTMSWNDSDGTMDIRLKGGNVTLQVGEETVVRVVNKSGVDLLEANYQVVRVRNQAEGGAQGQRLAVVLARANTKVNHTGLLGMVTETINSNQEGFVTNFGIVRDIDTTGDLQGETWVDGDVLWLSETTAGALTNIEPTTHPIQIGYVIYAHANNGKIFVYLQEGVDELDELHDVSITSVANNQGLFYDSATSLWKNKSIATALGYTPADAATTLTINGTTYDLSANRTWSVGTVTSVAALTLGTTGTDLSSSVATGTTTPVITLNVPTASAANRGALSAADWSTFNTKVGSVTASSPLASSGGSTPNITIQQSSGSQDGYLSSTDWTTFNNKQAAGNYITSLTGEATASGPGAAAVTLNNASVTAKVLTGINITGGTVQATDTMLTAFGKLQNQINGLIGSTIYQGTWNASTNTPALASGVGVRGYYYIVSVAGNTNLDGITDWFVGDWAIFDGTAWQQVDNTDAVVSVNGQTGAVSLTTDNISEGATNLYFTNARSRSSLSFAAGSGAYNSTTGVITIPTNTSQLTNGANFITLASLSGTAPIQYNNTTGAISITQAGTASNGYLSSTDWNTFNNKQTALTNPVTGTGTNNRVPKFTTTGSTIGDSTISDDGVVITLANSVTITQGLRINGTQLNFYGGTSEIVARTSPFLDLYSDSTTLALRLEKITGNATFLNSLSAQTITGSTIISSGTITANGNLFNANTTTLASYVGMEYQYNGSTYGYSKASASAGELRHYIGPTAVWGGYMTFWTNNTEWVRIAQSGNFLIGTITDAGFKLDVNGGGRFLSTGTANIRIKGSSTTGFDLQNDIGGSYLWNRDATPMFFGTENTLRLTIAANGAATFVSSVQAQSLIIRNTGVPAAQFFRDLDVTVVGSAGQNIEFGARSGSTFIAGALIGGGLDNPATTGTLVFQTRNAGALGTRLTIAANGAATFSNSLSAGNTITVNKGKAGSGIEANGFLDVVQVGTHAIGDSMLITFRGSGLPVIAQIAGILGADNVAYGSLAFSTRNYFTDSMVEMMRITNRNNVLIGTASGITGGGTLQVNGNVNINGAFQVNGVTIGGGGGSGVTGSGTTNYLSKWSSSSSISNSIIIDNGTNLGIATTSTSGRVTIAPPAVTNASTIEFTNTDNAAITAHFSMVFQVNNTNTVGGRSINFAKGGKGYGDATSVMMSILADNGNVLIGTTTDNGYKLQINGSASYAFGFLSIYRGSTGANDIFVGNDGNRIYIGGNTYVVGNVTATGGFFDTSDSRLKIVIKDYQQPKGIENVAARMYVKNGRKELGYFAQDLQQILPSAVSEGNDGFLTLSYSQVHTAKIAVIEDKVTILEREVSELKTKLQKYEA